MQDILPQLKSKHLAMINKNHKSFQYNSGDLVHIISPVTSQLRTAPRKVAIKYAGPLVIYKTVDPHNYLLMMLDGKILQGLFEHERLKPATIRTSHRYINSLVQLKQVLTLGMLYKQRKFICLKQPLRTETATNEIFFCHWNGKYIFL